MSACTGTHNMILSTISMLFHVFVGRPLTWSTFIYLFITFLCVAEFILKYVTLLEWNVDCLCMGKWKLSVFFLRVRIIWMFVTIFCPFPFEIRTKCEHSNEPFIYISLYLIDIMSDIWVCCKQISKLYFEFLVIADMLWFSRWNYNQNFFVLLLEILCLLTFRMAVSSAGFWSESGSQKSSNPNTLFPKFLCQTLQFHMEPTAETLLCIGNRKKAMCCKIIAQLCKITVQLCREAIADTTVHEHWSILFCMYVESFWGSAPVFSWVDFFEHLLNNFGVFVLP